MAGEGTVEGDETQTLSRPDAKEETVEGIRWFDFSDKDVVRHPLVGKIVGAYDRSDKEIRDQQLRARGDIPQLP